MYLSHGITTPEPHFVPLFISQDFISYYSDFITFIFKKDTSGSFTINCSVFTNLPEGGSRGNSMRQGENSITSKSPALKQLLE